MTNSHRRIQDNPFPQAEADPKTLHFFFLAEPAANADLKAIDAVKIASENYELASTVFYMYAPDGFGRSKLAKDAEKHLGVVTTARNLRTVNKIHAMLESE